MSYSYSKEIPDEVLLQLYEDGLITHSEYLDLCGIVCKDPPCSEQVFSGEELYKAYKKGELTYGQYRELIKLINN